LVASTKLLGRHDVRLLLDSSPRSPVKATKALKVDIEDGWDDLPSDAEDLFFFSQEEADEIRREKRRKLINAAQEARLAAMNTRDMEKDSSDIAVDIDEEVRVSITRGCRCNVIQPARRYAITIDEEDGSTYCIISKCCPT
jgi:hypothetical protein